MRRVQSRRGAGAFAVEGLLLVCWMIACALAPFFGIIVSNAERNPGGTPFAVSSLRSGRSRFWVLGSEREEESLEPVELERST